MIVNFVILFFLVGLVCGVAVIARTLEQINLNLRRIADHLRDQKP
jgi:hypothetical protein